MSGLKNTNLGKLYRMAKRIGALECGKDDISVESLQNFDNQQSAQKIAEHYAKISGEVSPVNKYERGVTVCTGNKTCMRLFMPLACLYKWIFRKIYVLVHLYLMSLSFKFHKDLSFPYGDIFKTI